MKPTRDWKADFKMQQLSPPLHSSYSRGESLSDQTERSAKSISDAILHFHGTTQLHQAPSASLPRRRGMKGRQ